MVSYHITTDEFCPLTPHSQRDCAGFLLVTPGDGSTGHTLDPISSSSHESDGGGRLPNALRHQGVHDLTSEVRDTPWEHRWMWWTCVRHRTRDSNRRASIDFCWLVTGFSGEAQHVKQKEYFCRLGSKQINSLAHLNKLKNYWYLS